MTSHRVFFVATVFGSCVSGALAQSGLPDTLGAQPGLAQPGTPRVSPASDGRDLKPPIPPKDARYTIYCQQITGPGHVEEAKFLRDAWAKRTGLRGFYIIHGEGDSSLYYEYYKNVGEDATPAEKARYKADRQMLAELTDAQGNKPFACLPVELPTADPDAPAEWNLTNARGFWTLEIAAFKNDPRRKEAAIQYVKELRDKGEEAYYYHGETTSSVCVGAWPREAVVAQEKSVAGTNDPTKDIVVSNQQLPDAFTKNLKTPDGEEVEVLTPKLQIADPRMLQKLHEYPFHSINYAIRVQKMKTPTGQTRKVADDSKLVEIPAPRASILRPAGPGADRPTNVPPPDAGRKSDQPGAGKLKSIGGF